MDLKVKEKCKACKGHGRVAGKYSLSEVCIYCEGKGTIQKSIELEEFCDLIADKVVEKLVSRLKDDKNPK